MSLAPVALLADAIAAQRERMRGYEVPSEALTFETIRALDYAFCRELFPRLYALSKSEQHHNFYLQSGVNEALSRVLPRELAYAEPHIFESSQFTQAKADQFLFDAGLLCVANRLHTQLRAGFLEGRSDPYRRVKGMRILVLTAADSTIYRESIGHAGVAWQSDRALLQGRSVEMELRKSREAMLPLVTGRLLSGIDDDEDLFPGADQHFSECANVYMSRMPYRDLLSDGDRIGGRPYSDYVAVLSALSAMKETRLCTTAIINSERPRVDIRNLLTGGAFANDLIDAVSCQLDAESADVNHLLGHLTLSPHNSSLHLARGTPAWAPIVQTSANFCVLPSFGLDMNPFIFLATELRERYKTDWFEAANARESRWVAELRSLFPWPRWRCADGLKVKREGKVATDIDFVAYDSSSRSVGLFQLKWQQPAVGDEKIRRNNAVNLLTESNRWVAVISEWLSEGGLPILAARLGVSADQLDCASLFVLGRYAAHFTGHSNADSRAVWSDWGHFERERTLHPKATVGETFSSLMRSMLRAIEQVESESYIVPLPGLAIVLNPAQQPARR